MSKVCVAVHPAAVSAKTDTETVVDNTGEGVNTFEVTELVGIFLQLNV